MYDARSMCKIKNRLCDKKYACDYTMHRFGVKACEDRQFKKRKKVHKKEMRKRIILINTIATIYNGKGVAESGVVESVKRKETTSKG